MKTLIASTSRTALIALALAAPVMTPVHAIAQDTEMKEDGTTDPLLAPKAGAEVDAEADPMADPMAPVGAETEMAEGEPEAQAVEGQITLQDQDTILAEDLLGAPVYNNEDEKVGDINDLIIALSGNVEGVVIGVGGFLGLGEKDVAIEMAQLQVATSEGDVQRLVTSASRADLESAPEFVTAQEQAREAEALKMQSETTGGTEIPVE